MTSQSAASSSPMATFPSYNVRNILFSSRDLLAGGIGGTVGAIVTCPFEVLKTKLQSHAFTRAHDLGRFKTFEAAKLVYRFDGVRGFWRGIGPTLVGVAPSRAVYFAAYSETKRLLLSKGMYDGMLLNLVSATAAGFASSTAMNPVWLVKTRLQLEVKGSGNTRYNGAVNAVKKIYAEEGIFGFYKGLSASYLGVSETVIQFVVYEHIKRRLREVSEDGGKKSSHVVAAATAAKLIACTTTYPHEVIRTRMRERQGQEIYNGLISGLKKIYQQEGFRGLYSGMGAHLARTVPNSAVMFLTYELVVDWLSTLGN